jgi:two-component system, NarL family, nitrate/nitrite response regulator NarL
LTGTRSAVETLSSHTIVGRFFPEEATIRVLMFEAHQLFAEVVRNALREHGFDVVAVTEDGDQAIRLARDLDTDLVLLDVAEPGGLSVGKEILEHEPGTKVIALTGLDDPALAEEALDLGFHAFLTKEASIDSLVQAMRDATEGRGTVHRMNPERSKESRSPDLAQHLTSREREILELLVACESSASIAARLRISGNTVRTHVQSVLIKLQVHSRLEAATLAVREGLVDTGQTRRRGTRSAWEQRSDEHASHG